MMETKINILDYLDYRSYLKDYIEFVKLENPSFSMRAFAAKIQCNPGQFNRILNGERNLTSSLIIEICTVLKFSRKEKRYFELLTAYNHSKKQSEREYNFGQMQSFRKANIKEISADQYQLYSHWYNVVLRELLSIYKCTDLSESECRKIGKMMIPQVSHSEISSAIKLLMALGVLEKNKDGTIGSADAFTASGEAIPQVITNRFLLEFTDLAQRAVDAIPRDQRRLSTLTFSVSQVGYKKISERIDEFRRELLAMVDADDGVLDKVYHLNLHLFPVSKGRVNE
ncbi:MAG: TIGR02147 family protein [Fibrobacter sp.]|nr:TIGR02147 family protein [Fibrobacter sp.]